MNKPTRRRNPRRLQPVGIMVVMDDGPHRCLVPIPRSDLPAQTPEFTLPYLFGTVLYRLERIDDARVHHYRYVPPADVAVDLPATGTAEAPAP